MRETMWRQPAELERLLADRPPVEALAARLAGRRVFLVGTGTSWHAANHGVWFLREAGVDAVAVQAIDAALYGLWAKPGDAVVVMSHGNRKLYATRVIEEMRAAGIECVVITGLGVRGGDLETVEMERSAAFTASHTGALMRLAQLAELLGAELGDLARVPRAVEAVLEGPGLGVEPPERILEFGGVGPNQWTAAEGALKVREACYIATEGLSVEQLLHGPAVALQRGDVLVALDGGGPGSERVEKVAAAGAVAGATVHSARAQELGEHLSVFPLLVHVQRIALELAETLGINPDIFRRDQHTAWDDVGF